MNLSWECICSLNRLKFHYRILYLKLRLEAVNRFLTHCGLEEQCFQNSSAAGLIYHLHPYKKQLKNISVEGRQPPQIFPVGWELHRIIGSLVSKLLSEELEGASRFY